MATFKILLYTHKTYSNNKHPVMGVISHNSKVFRFTIDSSFTAVKDEWDKNRECFSKKMIGYSDKNRALFQLREHIDGVFDKIRLSRRPFTLELFKNEFRKKSFSGGLIGFFDLLIMEYKKSGRIGNMEVYLDTKRSLIKFLGLRSIQLEDVDYNLLKGYEAFLRSTGCSNGGISVYLRTLRAALNQAINRSYLDAGFYPFASSANKINKYSISNIKSNYNPRSITEDELTVLKSFDVNLYQDLAKSYHYFFFSYYTAGMNFMDMAFLRWEDIHNNRINYVRSKTKGHISILISEKIEIVLDYFNQTSQLSTGYIFPILDDRKHVSRTQQANRIKKCLQTYNRELKLIGEILGLRTKLSSYTARHTFAQTLKEHGISTEIISQKLDHKNLATTKHYLKGLGNSSLDEVDLFL